MIPKRRQFVAVLAVAVLAAGADSLPGPPDAAAAPLAAAAAVADSGASGSAVGAAGSQRPSFAGTWRLDADASEVAGPEGLYGLGGSAPEDLYVTQARNGALILSSRVNGAQPRNYVIGGENLLPAPGGEAARMTMRSRWEGENLVSTGSGEHEGAAVSVREVMSLSPDGRRLYIDVTTVVGGVEATNSLVYTRASR